MCGRYYRRSDKQRIGDAFNIADLPSSLILSEDYNVAPTTFQPVTGLRHSRLLTSRRVIQLFRQRDNGFQVLDRGCDWSIQTLALESVSHGLTSQECMRERQLPASRNLATFSTAGT